jgi:hypothetical protein
MWGRREMHSADTNLVPTNITCDKFLSSHHSPGWYHITGCDIDVLQHVDEESEYKNKDTGQPIVTKSFYLVHNDNPKPEISLIVKASPENFSPKMDLLGLVVNDDPDSMKGGALTSEREAVVKFEDRVAPNWYLLRQGEKPSRNFGIGLVVVGALLFLLSSFAFLGVLVTLRPGRTA